MTLCLRYLVQYMMLRLELRLAYAACPACVSACEAVNHRDSMVSFQNLKPSSAQRSCVFARQGLQALQQSDVRHLAQKHGHTSDQSCTAWMNLYRSQLTYKKLCECLILPSNVHVYFVVLFYETEFSIFSHNVT